jgi:hypothetical protein
VMTQPWAKSKVMNPSSVIFTQNLDAQTFAASDRLVTRLYDVHTDAFAIVPQPFHALDFRPQFVESMHGLKFVYLDPPPLPSVADAAR